MHFTDDQPHLLKKEFVVDTIIKHFYPLFHDHLREAILRFVYRKGIEITVNGELLILPDTEQRVDNEFKVFLGKGRRPIGAGFLTKKVLEQGWLARLAGRAPNELRIASGLSISTYGKVIKTGWEWVGIIPKSAGALCGVVEVPAVSEVLTTNKSDFLTDAAPRLWLLQARAANPQPPPSSRPCSKKRILGGFKQISKSKSFSN